MPLQIPLLTDEEAGLLLHIFSLIVGGAQKPLGRFTEFVEALGGRWRIIVWFDDGSDYRAGQRARSAERFS